MKLDVFFLTVRCFYKNFKIIVELSLSIEIILKNDKKKKLIKLI